jgi:hypothetical protein
VNALKILGREVSTAAILAFIGIIILFGIVTYVAAATLFSHTHPNNGVIPEEIGFLTRLGGNTFNDGDAIVWGNLVEGTQQKVLYVENTGNVAYTVTVTATGLPAQWTEIWDNDGVTLQPGEHSSGNLILTIPAGTGAPGTYTWNLFINGESIP